MMYANQKMFSEQMQKMFQQNAEYDVEEFRELINVIKKYDVFDFIARISVLNLLIENQNKSILFDALIAGLLSESRSEYTSTVKMSNGKFRTVMNRLANMKLAYRIDPAENSFIERIRYYRDYWIFPGINYNPAYCFQGFLNAIYLRDFDGSEDFRNQAKQIIEFVLTVSDLAAQKLGYDLDSVRHCEEHEIRIPDSALSEKLQFCVVLDFAFLQEFITDSTLYELFFSEFEPADLFPIVKNDVQKFFARPFLKIDASRFLVLNPSILIPFAIHQIILLADRCRCKEQLVNAYNDEIWMSCQKSLKELGHKKIDEKAYGIQLMNTPCRKEKILTVGNNMLLFVHFVCDDGEGYSDECMFDRYKGTGVLPSTSRRTQYFIDRLPEMQNDGIYQIILINSFGRNVGNGVTEAEREYSVFLSPFELKCISINERDRGNFIARYINAKRKMVETLPPMYISELNSVEIYRSNDYSFYLSDDFDPKTTPLMFAPGDSLDYVIRAIKAEDRHLIDHYDGIHLCEVVLDDAARNIYFSEGGLSKAPELVVKFERVNIWITSELPHNFDELNVYQSILDGVSYWLAECKAIINSLSFCHDTLRLHVAIAPPIEKYYGEPKCHGNFGDYITYTHCSTKIKMMWQASAYQMLGEKTNTVEKDMLISILHELEKYCHNKIDISKVDSVFSLPLKKKFYAANIANAPYLIPIYGELQTISSEEENLLLDEIGGYFLSMPEYTYGKVPDEKRSNLANQVVAYLYSLLQDEVSSVRADGVFERVISDLETVMHRMMLAQNRYAYDISCYPEKTEKTINRIQEANKASVALKFFAEYIAACPPRGNKLLGELQYDRILAICSLIVDWAYKNDLFRYNIFNSPVRFLRSGRIGLARTEGDYLAKINASARSRRLESLSNPDVDTYFPSNLLNDLQTKIDDAFEDEYGFTFKQFVQCILAIAEYGDEMPGDVKRVPREIVVSEISKREKLEVELIQKVINHVILTQRQDFLVPPAPYGKVDVYPWRFNRELSFTRRPIIQFNEDLIWGNRQLHHMWRYTIDLILEGKYKARRPQLSKLIGKLGNKRGDDFNTAVAKKLKSIDGLIVQDKLSKINRKKITDSNGNVLGDIDVLYIIPDKRKIVVGEVKDYSFAKNPYEMEQEYRRIFVDDERPCYLTKHKRRVQWVKDHVEDVKTHFNLPDGTWSVHRVMFVSEEIVSNLFYHQNEKIVVYSDISEKSVKGI